MLTVTVLGSGSRGNAILVDGSEGSVLVDAGFGARALAKRFETAGRTPHDVGALLLSHEHVDHASGASAASARWGWPVYGTAATLAALATTETPVSHTVVLESSTVVCGLRVDHVSVPHDAADCRALVLTDLRSGARAGVVLDCGAVPPHLATFLDRLDLLVLESNHDETLLASGPYPWPLKERIRGGRGHLSNASAGELARACMHRGLRGLVLAHLSETNNTPDLALTAMRRALAGSRRLPVHLLAAPQATPTDAVSADGSIGRLRARQLSLF